MFPVCAAKRAILPVLWRTPNTTWRKDATSPVWHCSWRYAGGIVAGLRGEGDYLDWYCSMGEGLVDEQVLTEIRVLGWELVEANPPDW